VPRTASVLAVPVPKPRGLPASTTSAQRACRLSTPLMPGYPAEPTRPINTRPRPHGSSNASPPGLAGTTAPESSSSVNTTVDTGAASAAGASASGTGDAASGAVASGETTGIAASGAG
jgi:hypothetical protein